MSDKPRLSRRELLKHAGLAGTVAVIPAPLATAGEAAPSLALADEPQSPATPAVREAFETLTAAESDTLEAITKSAGDQAAGDRHRRARDEASKRIATAASPASPTSRTAASTSSRPTPC